MKDKREAIIWVFVAGIMLAAVQGIFGTYIGNATMIIQLALIVLGVAVGFFGISHKDSVTFMLVSLALIITSSMASQALGVVMQIGSSLNAILLMLVPAVIIVGLKTILNIVRN